MLVENLRRLHDEIPVGESVHLYVDGAFGRRDLIERVTRPAGSLAAAMLALGGFDELHAQATPAPPGVRAPENEPDSGARDVTYSGIVRTSMVIWLCHVDCVTSNPV